MTEMENRRGEFVVIAAGYPAEMQQFLLSNPGLESRFDRTIHFRDYTDQELVEIFRRRAVKQDYELAPGALERLATVIAGLDRGTTFANARTIRKLFLRTCVNQERRLVATGLRDRDSLSVLTPEDIPSPSAPTTTSNLFPGYL